MSERRTRYDRQLKAQKLKPALKVYFEEDITRFLLVSALDVFMTFILLYEGQFEESNPIARYFLDRWGLAGMIYFKFALAAIVCCISQIVARKKPHLARFVLQFGTVVVACVVLYSLWLFLQPRDAAEVTELESFAQSIAPLSR
jgi:Domain of unknown function (DUF5658)